MCCHHQDVSCLETGAHVLPPSGCLMHRDWCSCVCESFWHLIIVFNLKIGSSGSGSFMWYAQLDASGIFHVFIYIYIYMNDFLPGCLFAVVVINVLWLEWMCDECTWHHKTFLVQSVYWHLAIKLYCIVFVGELAFTNMFCLTITGRRWYIIYSITIRKEMVWSCTEDTGLSQRRLVGQPSPPSFSVVSFEQALMPDAH